MSCWSFLSLVVDVSEIQIFFQILVLMEEFCPTGSYSF